MTKDQLLTLIDEYAYRQEDVAQTIDAIEPRDKARAAVVAALEQGVSSVQEPIRASGCFVGIPRPEVVGLLREASAFISAVLEGAAPNIRYPLPDELDGVACMLEDAMKSVAADAEPVAWEIETESQQGGYNKWVTTDKKDLLNIYNRGAPVPLYAAPQPAEPLELSDAIKRDLIVNWFADHWTQKAANGLLEDYARAILAAAKAKRGVK